MYFANKRIFARKKKLKVKPEKEEQKTETITKSTNVFSLQLGILEDKANDIKQHNHIKRCKNCDSVINMYSKVRTKSDFLVWQEEQQKKKVQDPQKEEEKDQEKIKEEKTENDSDLEDEEDEEEEKKLLDEDIPQDGFVWCCEFCNTNNIFEEFNKKIISSENQVDYLISEASKKKQDEKEKEKEEEEEIESVEDNTCLVFCVDVSGSMGASSRIPASKMNLKEVRQLMGKDFGQEISSHSGYSQVRKPMVWGSNMNRRQKNSNKILIKKKPQMPQMQQMQQMPQMQQMQQMPQPKIEEKKEIKLTRLDCVKLAIANQVSALSKIKSNKKVLLVTFGSTVRIFHNTQTTYQELGSNENFDKDKLIKTGENVELTTPVNECDEQLMNNIKSLRTRGSTALGPALAVSCGIAGKFTGSKVVLCTDGMANVGIGQFGQNQEQSSKFYEDISIYAQEHGVAIDLITIKGTDCNIDTLGKLCDETNGEVDIVEPAEMSTKFDSILSNPVIATDALLELSLHHALYIYDDDDRKIGAKMEKEIGNVTKLLELSFTYGVKDPEDVDEKDERKATLGDSVPFQAQIRFTRLDGSKWIRIITSQLEITEKAEEALEDLDFGLLNMNMLQRAGNFALRGNIEQSKQWVSQQQDLYNVTSQNKRFQNSSFQKQQVSFNQQQQQFNSVFSEEKKRGKSRRSDKNSNFLYSAKKWNKK